MHPEFLIGLLPFIAWLVFVTGFSYVLQLVFKCKHQGKRSSLTRHLLRSPGASLRLQLESVEAGLNFYIVQLLFFPILVYSIYITQQSAGPAKLDELAIAILVFFVGGFLIYYLYKFWRLLLEQRRLSLALDCELAVGQELNLLTQKGYRVYHDFPGKDFNIDHVLVGPAGVYVVETKARVKPNRGRSESDVRMFYDGTTLNFPGWVETKPILQAKEEAEWLSKWLEKVVGEPVPVKATVILPGWFVRSERRHEVSVINEKHTKFLANPRGDYKHSEERTKRIAWQVEQHCRNVEPVGFRKNVKWHGV